MGLHTLENGLRVWIQPVPNRVVTVDAWVAAGSADETSELNGVAHFLEHMLFKGTPTYGPGELDEAIMSVGGSWNAGTSKDFTHYYATVAAPFWERALDCILEMIHQPLLDRDEFDREKQVILEEWRRKQDNPWGVLYDELYHAAFESGPYRQSVIGTFESISGLTRDGMAEFHATHYVTQRIVLCVVGDLDEAQALRVIANRASAFDRRGTPIDYSRQAPAKRLIGDHRILEQDVQETYVGIAYAAPSIQHAEDVVALDVAATILGDGRSSRLYRTLKEEKRLVNTVSAGMPTHRHDSVFYVGATCGREKLAQAKSEITQVLERFADQGPTEDELRKAARLLKNGWIFGNETNSGQSGVFGYYYAMTGSHEFADAYLNRVDEVTPQKAKDAVQRWVLAAEPCSVAVVPKQQ